MSDDALYTLLANAILDSVEAILPPAPTRASLGGLDPDGNYAVSVSGTARVYLHNEAAETLDTALNINAPLIPNCPVLLYVFGQVRYVTFDPERIEAFMGNTPYLNAVGPHTHNDPYGGLWDMVNLKRLLNGTLVPKAGMTVKLLSKPYWSDDGTKILFYQQNDSTGIYDITPAAPTAGNRRLVLVGITRSTGAPTHKSGPLKAILSTASISELAGVDLSDFEPWRAINYRYGATTITFEDIYDVSPLTSSKYDSFGTGTIKTLSSDKIAAGGDRHLIVAAQTGTADNLIEITGLVIGVPVIVRADTGDTITVKHNDAGATDKIILYNGADTALSGDKTLELVKTASSKVLQLMGTGDFLRDGSLAMTGDLNLGGNDITNVANFAAKNTASIVKNTSGATVAEGDVGIVIYDATNGWVYQRTTTANYPFARVGVVLLGGANNANIYVARSGVGLANYTGTAPAAGHWLVTSTTGGSAQRSTVMRPEIFAVCLAAGSGGQVSVQLLLGNPFVPISDTNNVHQVTGHSETDFRTTINGAPSTTSVVYTAPLTSGAENVINVAAGQLAKLRLWNETRSTYRLITSVDTVTNTITTPATTDAWATTDVITIRSQTNTSVSGTAYFMDLDFSGTSVVPLLARAVLLSYTIADSAAIGLVTLVHPFEANDGSKADALRVLAINTDKTDQIVVPLLDQKFCIRETASGAGTRDTIFKLRGYWLAVP